MQGEPVSEPSPRASADESTPDLPLGLALVFALSALAGAVDACGLTILKDLFVSFMSGNTTSLAVAIGHGDRARILGILPLIVTFVAGAAAGTVLAILAGRRHLPVVVLAVALILALPLVAPAATVLAMTCAMGALNAAMNRAGAVSVSLTYVTGTLVKLGAGLGHLVCGRAKDWVWLEQGVPWLGLVTGGVLAALGLSHVGKATIDALPLVALAIAIGAWLALPRAT